MLKKYVVLVIVLVFASNMMAQSAWKNYNTANSDIGGNTIRSYIKIDSKDNKWFFTSDGNVNSYILTKFDGTNWTNYKNPASVGQIIIDKVDNIWVGSADKLHKFDGIKWTTYIPSMTLSIDGQFESLAADKQGNIWVGTFEDGLFKFDGINWTKMKNGTGTVRSIFVDASNNIWICQDGDGLSKFDGTNWTKYNVPNSSGGILVTIDNKDNKWIVNYKNELLKFDGSNWTNYNISNNDKLSGSICSIASDNHNNVWVAVSSTFSNGGVNGGGCGVSKFDGVSWINYTRDNSYIVSSNVNSIAIDSKGDKWIGSDKGIFKLTGLGNSNLCKPYTPADYITCKNFARCSGNSFSALYSLDKSASNTYTWIDEKNNLLNNKNIDSQIVKTSGKYILKIEDSVCFRTIETNVIITDTLPAIKDLCMVTNQNGHNLLLWDNTSNNYIIKYRIYKENHTTSKYDLIYEQSKKKLSEWLDTLSSNQIERYKLAVVDSCGNESAQSIHHTTILLSSNLGINGTVNLAWNPYEGFDYQNFEIWRSLDGVNYNLLSSVANKTYAYIDYNPPVTGYYQIRIVNPTTCNPSVRNISSVISNTVDKNGKIIHVAGLEDEMTKTVSFRIFPNPNQGVFHIENVQPNTIFSLFDLTGQKVYEQISTNTSLEVTLGQQVNKGIYFLQASYQGNILGSEKIIIE